MSTITVDELNAFFGGEPYRALERDMYGRTPRASEPTVSTTREITYTALPTNEGLLEWFRGAWFLDGAPIDAARAEALRDAQPMTFGDGDAVWGAAVAPTDWLTITLPELFPDTAAATPPPRAPARRR